MHAFSRYGRLLISHARNYCYRQKVTTPVFHNTRKPHGECLLCGKFVSVEKYPLSGRIMQSVSQNTAVAKSSVAPSYQLRFMPPVFILVLLECATEETIISGVLDRSVDIIIKIKIVKEGRKTNVGRFVYGICDAIIAEKPRDYRRSQACTKKTSQTRR